MNPFGDIHQRLVIGLNKVGLAVKSLQWQRGEVFHLTPLQQHILYELKRQPGRTLTIGALARNIGVKPPTITEAVKTLMAKGFVEKSKGTEDGRFHCVRLISPDPNNVIGNPDWADALRDAISGLTEEEQKALLKLTIRLIEQFQRRGIVQRARICSFCTYFRPEMFPNSPQPHYCAFVGLPMGDGDIQTDCPDFQEDSAVTLETQ